MTLLAGEKSELGQRKQLDCVRKRHAEPEIQQHRAIGQFNAMSAQRQLFAPPDTQGRAAAATDIGHRIGGWRRMRGVVIDRKNLVQVFGATQQSLHHRTRTDNPAVGADDKMHRYQHGGFIRADLV